MVQIVTSVIVGVATWAALALLGLEQAALWGLLAGLFNSIPYYGPLIVSGGLALVAFLQFGTPYMMLLVAGVSLVITSLEGWLLTPTLMGRVASMNRVAVFVGLVVLELGVGCLGPAARGADDDVHQSDLRSRRGSQARRALPRRMTADSFTVRPSSSWTTIRRCWMSSRGSPKMAGFDVVACANGKDALNQLADHRADVAVVDLRLPDVGGIEVLRAIREADPDCQVILMSGDATIDSAVEAVKLGAVDYLTKPLDFARLNQLLTTCATTGRAGAGCWRRSRRSR